MRQNHKNKYAKIDSLQTAHLSAKSAKLKYKKEIRVGLAINKRIVEYLLGKTTQIRRREDEFLYIFIEIQYKHRKSPGKDL